MSVCPPSVSIHAPARGATLITKVGDLWLLGFQSTRPRGARLTPRIRREQGQGFNPRAREGRDQRQVCCCNVISEFQSTRPRGARRGETVHAAREKVFQSTRPRGARHTPSTVRAADRSFNPRAREGRDLYRVMNSSHVTLFQSTRPRGARRSKTFMVCAATLFQSTRPRGARP